NTPTPMADPLRHAATVACDAASRKTSATDRNGNVINYAYDNSNRETGEAWLVSGSTVNTLTFSYDPTNNLLGAANSAGSYTMAYDSINRMTANQEPFGLSLTYSYDAVGNRTLVQDSLGGLVTSVYDNANNLTSRKFAGAAQTRIDLTYTARKQIATVTRYKNVSGAANQKVGSSAYSY